MDPHVFHRVVAALVGDLLRGPQAPDQGDHLVGAAAAFLDRHLARAELLRVLPTDADAEDHAPVGDAVEVGDLLGHERGWIERQEQDRRADLHPLGQRREPGQAHHRLGTRVARRDVPADPQRVDGLVLERRGPARVAAGHEPDADLVVLPVAVNGVPPLVGRARRERARGASSSTSSLSWPMSGPGVTAQSRSEKSHGARITRVRPISGCSMSTKTPRAATCGSVASASFVMTAIAGTPAACSVSNASREERRRVHALIASSMTSPAARARVPRSGSHRSTPPGRARGTAPPTPRRRRRQPRPSRRHRPRGRRRAGTSRGARSRCGCPSRHRAGRARSASGALATTTSRDARSMC